MTLVVSGLARHFGGVQAVRDVSFTLHPGECVALIGPNGAGKSTTFACIAGQLPLLAGSVVWNGARIDTLDPAERMRRGVARTFQVAQVFEALTVLQNLQLLMQIPRGLNVYDDLDRCAKPSAQALLEQVDLGAWGNTLARHVPYGAKKRLELAMALAGLQDCGLGVPRQRPHDAQLLLLDEPAAGLAASERQTLMALVHSLTRRDRGRTPMAVLYTEHNMDAVFGVADRVLVLIDGVLVADGTPDAIARDPQVRERYLGHGWDLQEHLREGRDA